MMARSFCNAWATVAVTALVVGLGQGVATAQDRIVFEGKTTEGEVWVSTDLTRHRLSEEFVPLVVVVRNSASRPASLDRASFELVGADGKVNPLPDVKTVRERYRRMGFDRTALRLVGIPFGTRLDLDRVQPSEFFPVVGAGSGILIDEVTLPPLSWTVDMLYFRRPAGLDEGREVTLRVKADGWEIPVLVKLDVS